MRHHRREVIIMNDKTYDVIVRMKEKGDFDTYYCDKVIGKMTDKSVKMYLTSKVGKKRTVEVSTDMIESIEREGHDKPEEEDEANEKKPKK